MYLFIHLFCFIKDDQMKIKWFDGKYEFMDNKYIR